MKRIFSGVQPTGNLHLGNYLGAIKNWVSLQQDYQSLFCIVNLHAITVPQDPEKLRQSIYTTAAAYIACGIDHKNAIIFPQSAIAAHSELAWILNCFTPLGWLNRMTQFKEKAGKNKEKACLGLYSYPVLMAADILLYQATHVPVGEDQKQHLELTRDIAGAFNRHVNDEFFTIPEPVILGDTARVMSLRDGTKKMSKSDESDYSRINLTDDADTIALKLKKAKSDALPGIEYDPEKRPEAANLLAIFSAITGSDKETLSNEYASKGFAAFKTDLADALIAHLGPITDEINRLTNDKAQLDIILREGATKALAIADKTLSDTKKHLGFIDA